jgi:hypothetical protein
LRSLIPTPQATQNFQKARAPEGFWNLHLDEQPRLDSDRWKDSLPE